MQVTAGNLGSDRVHMAISLPSASATVVRLAPMPASLSVDVVMHRETL